MSNVTAAWPTYGVVVLDGRVPSLSKCVTDPATSRINGRAIAAQCCTLDNGCVRTTNGGRRGCISGKFHRNNESDVFEFFETTWSWASSRCAALGLTLCNQNCQGTGCSYDRLWVWTNTACPSPPAPPALPPASPPPVPPASPPPACDLTPANASAAGVEFFVYSSPTTWPNARDYCGACHTGLAKVTSPAEDLALAHVAATLDVDGVWLSGTTLVDAANYYIDHRHDYGQGVDPTDLGNWYWYPDAAATFNTSSIYMNWGGREPNNGAGGRGEYCLVVATVASRPTYLLWANYLCTRRAAFACV